MGTGACGHTPEARNGGLGGLLIDATLRVATELGLERVTVHSSKRAVLAYERHGFAASPHLLQIELRRPGGPNQQHVEV